MKNRLLVVVALAALMSLVAGLACGQAAVEPTDTGEPVYEPVTLVDGAGQEFVFTEPPERIVAYDSAVVEILFAIGEGHRIVGTHDFVEYPPEASEVARIGSAFEINVESILALEPDLVFLFSPGFVDDLQGAGLSGPLSAVQKLQVRGEHFPSDAPMRRDLWCLCNSRG